jgi:pantoate--beta-alanine ligase
MPDAAFFGQKDYQQFLVIKKLIDDFDLKINLSACAIIREDNGLAMSSRNIRLNAQEIQKARSIYQSLLFVKENYKHLEFDVLLDRAKQFYQNDVDIRLEYFSICDQETLRPIVIGGKSKAIALVACFIGETRLIDNMMLD